MHWLLSGPLWFTSWISFVSVFILCTAESLSLLYLLFISDLYVLGDDVWIS